MNFLDTKFIKSELGIKPSQLKTLVDDYRKIIANGDKELENLKAELEKQAMRTLSAAQRKTVNDWLKSIDNEGAN